jgi:hypothetical protein
VAPGASQFWKLSVTGGGWEVVRGGGCRCVVLDILFLISYPLLIIHMEEGTRVQDV